MTAWFDEWQRSQHAQVFDYRAALDPKSLVREYESYNETSLLNERVPRERPGDLLEIGCATGEFYRYLRLTRPGVRYYGLDISRPAIERARAKYPEARFFMSESDRPLAAAIDALRLPPRFEVVYSRDVMHHQLEPREFLAGLLSLASEASIIRCRTRDVGSTEMDPERSCQRHCDGWVPYIVVNLEELIGWIRSLAPDAEVAVYRHHVALGGANGRFLPKECYLPETGTAETAVAILKKASEPGRVIVEDRREMNPIFSPIYYTKRMVARAAEMLGKPT